METQEIFDYLGINKEVTSEVTRIYKDDIYNILSDEEIKIIKKARSFEDWLRLIWLI